MRSCTMLSDHAALLRFCEIVAGKHGHFSPISLTDGMPLEQQEHVLRVETLCLKAFEECPERIHRAYKAMGTVLLQSEGFEMNYKGEVPYEQAGEKLDTL